MTQTCSTFGVDITLAPSLEVLSTPPLPVPYSEKRRYGVPLGSLVLIHFYGFRNNLALLLRKTHPDPVVRSDASRVQHVIKYGSYGQRLKS